MAVAKQRKSESAVAGRLSRAATYEKPATSGGLGCARTSAAILDRLSAFEASLDPVIDVAHLPALLVQRDED
jgi:hypothetical protein